MTTELCEALSERMPAVAAGEGTWSSAESAHLSICVECAAEWRLVQQARQLGAGAAGRLDTAGLGAAVLQGVAARHRAARRRRGAWLTGLAAAAAVTLVVWTGTGGRGPGVAATGRDSAGAGTVEHALYLPLAELESLDAEQLQGVLDGLDTPISEPAPGGVPSFGELDDHQLERVLRSLEG
jgi:hypothetical protein